MPELNDETQNVDMEQGGKKSKLLLWIGLGIGSFIIVFIATFIWIVYVQKPDFSDKAAITALSDSLAQQQTQQVAASKNNPLQDTVQTTQEQTTTIKEPSSSDTAEIQTNMQNTMVAANISPNNGATDQNIPSTPPKEDPPDYRQLAKIYSQMDVKAAANILSRLSTQMVVGILSEMRDRNAAQILMAFKPDRAASLSKALSLQK